MMNNNYIFALTEFKNAKTTNDISLWIYTMPIVEIKNKHSENYTITKKLERLNSKNVIVFHENLIVSFSEIKEWDGEPYNNSENRVIDCSNSKERVLLEKLLLKDIQSGINKDKFEVLNPNKSSNSVHIKKPLLYQDNIILKRKMNFNINVKDDTSIVVGFDLSHSYDFINTLDKELSIVRKGDKVKDFYYGGSYEFIGIAPFTISEKNEYMDCSVIEYYKNKNQSYVVDRFSPDTRPVLVMTKDKHIYPYLPNRLKRVFDKSKMSNS